MERMLRCNKLVSNKKYDRKRPSTHENHQQIGILIQFREWKIRSFRGGKEREMGIQFDQDS